MNRQTNMWHTGEGDCSKRAMVAMACVILAFMFAAGCGNGGGSGFASGEKLVYLENNGAASRILLTTVAGGRGHVYLEWPENSGRFSIRHDGNYFTDKLPETSGDDETRRFSFSNDGRYFVAIPQTAAGAGHPVVVSTDGATVSRLPAGAVWPAISPDSSQVAYCRPAASGQPPTVVAVFDLDSGRERVLAQGRQPENPSWVDGHSLIYSEKSMGAVYMLDSSSGFKKQLTPPGRFFSHYSVPASHERKKIALMESVGQHNNIFSLDLTTGRLHAITNNSRYKQKPSYLPGTDTVLFQETPQGTDPHLSADLFLVGDEGSGFSIVVDDYFSFNGLYALSLASGKIAYQHVESDKTAVWVSNAGNGGGTPIAESDEDWLGDPNFVPVELWRETNPLELSVSVGEPGEGLLGIEISNPAVEDREAILRLFPGRDLQLLAAAGTDSFTGTGSVLELQLSLKSGEARQIRLPAVVNSHPEEKLDATVLVTLAIPGAPPLMSWRDLAI